MLEKLQKLNLRKIKIDYNLPQDYVVSKFFELGFYPKHNRYNDTYQCSCPICREGDSFGRQKRCYYIPDKDLIYCHNCGWSSKPFKWVKEVSGMSDKEIQEEVDESSYNVIESFNFDKKEDVVEIPSLPEDCINLFDPTQLEYYNDNKIVRETIRYIQDRKLDIALNKPDALYLSLKDKTHKNRLVLPFKDSLGKISHYQSRKIFVWDDKPKYTSKVGGERSICGIDKVSDSIDSVFLFEGPIDSFFVKNGIAVGGINGGEVNFTSKQEDQMDSLKFYKKIWCLDSQWLDKTSREKTQVLIDNGEWIFIWPEKYGKHFKDLNEMCVHYNLSGVSPDFIKKNSFQFKEAIMRFNLLKTKLL